METFELLVKIGPLFLALMPEAVRQRAWDVAAVLARALLRRLLRRRTSARGRNLREARA